MNEELSNKFFEDLTEILKEHIVPKSQIVADEIKLIIKSVCRSHGYFWWEKHECVGTYDDLPNQSSEVDNI